MKSWGSGTHYMADYEQVTLVEGVDYYVGSDGIAHFFVGPPPPGKTKPAPEVVPDPNEPPSANVPNTPATSPPPSLENVELLTTAEVAAIGGNKRQTVQVLDLWTGLTFNISWASSENYHTDWTPMTPEDVAIIQSILNPDGKDVDWNDVNSWSWAARPGVISVEGRQIAVGFHLRPHAAIMGGNPGAPFVNDSNTSPGDREPELKSWPMGGHMCMYYGDSPGKTSGMNEAAREAYRLANG